MQITKQCSIHGTCQHRVRKDIPNSSRCVKCESEKTKRWRTNVKELLVKEAGGKCIKCGYSKNVMGAFHFHHRDPNEKSFGIGSGGYRKGIKTLRLEAAKCDLLCGNCHSEIHELMGETPDRKR